MSDSALLAALESLPDEALVPVGWIRSRLDDDGAGSDPVGDLSVADVGRALDRSPSTIRAWCARGDVPGAYRLHGREWRIPRASLRRYLDEQAEKASSDPDGSGGETVDLGRWRRHLRGSD